MLVVRLDKSPASSIFLLNSYAFIAGGALAFFSMNV